MNCSLDTFRLEIARPGPLHGQLLSKLTNYLALCDGVEADTFQLGFDHHEITEDLLGLRYYLGDAGTELVPNALRTASLERLSRRLATTLDQMRSFQTRFAEGAKDALTHLRLILNGNELSLVPFELATVPVGWRGSGAKLMLQARARTVLTRELRDSNRYPVEWNRPPRVLFCTASPKGFAPPPAQAHLQALTSAMRDWCERDRHGNRPLKPADVITVLEDASIDTIAEATASAEYTHVHILAHGCALPHQRDRYGLALAQRRDSMGIEAVDAKGLAQALWGQHRCKQPPTLVSLASCDSANQNTVIRPGSSIAHELHQEGVPWVVASQMPLTFKGSTTLTRLLYGGLFNGDDPRWVLYRLRGELARDPESHDWASLVVYASFPNNFDEQVHDFAIGQIKSHINSAFERARNRPTSASEEFSRIDRHIDRWQALLPQRVGRNDVDRSEFLGMRGSICKQTAELELADEPEPPAESGADPGSTDALARAKARLHRALTHYREAAALQLGSHWVVVQYLSLCELLVQKPDSGWREVAERSAALELETENGRIWAMASLLELALLDPDGNCLGKNVEDWAKEFALGIRSRDDFAYFSTKRQLRRYFEGGLARFASKPLRERARKAVEIIEQNVRD
jgi:hypothetical protein